MADHLSTSEESDEDCSQIFEAGDKFGYECLELFDSPSSDVLASDSEAQDLPFRKRPRYETAPVSRVPPSTLKPNYPNHDRECHSVLYLLREHQPTVIPPLQDVAKVQLFAREGLIEAMKVAVSTLKLL